MAPGKGPGPQKRTGEAEKWNSVDRNVFLANSKAYSWKRCHGSNLDEGRFFTQQEAKHNLTPDEKSLKLCTPSCRLLYLNSPVGPVSTRKKKCSIRICNEETANPIGAANPCRTHLRTNDSMINFIRHVPTRGSNSCQEWICAFVEARFSSESNGSGEWCASTVLLLRFLTRANWSASLHHRRLD